MKKNIRTYWITFYKLSKQIENPNDYLFQFIGIDLNGKKYIYINSFYKSELSEAKRVHKNLKTSPVVVCGGGSGFWRASLMSI